LDLIPVQTTPGYGYGYRYECEQKPIENNNKTRLKRNCKLYIQDEVRQESQDRKLKMHLNASKDVMGMQEP
jgi:hypothetical protein